MFKVRILQAYTLSDVRWFGHCQRVIALRKAISPDTDDLLRRLLRHRYVWLEGGTGEVEGQYNAWLTAPGSISASPRRSALPKGMEGNSARAKRRPNRYP